MWATFTKVWKWGEKISSHSSRTKEGLNKICQNMHLSKAKICLHKCLEASHSRTQLQMRVSIEICGKLQTRRQATKTKIFKFKSNFRGQTLEIKLSPKTTEKWFQELSASKRQLGAEPNVLQKVWTNRLRLLANVASLKKTPSLCRAAISRRLSLQEFS